MNRERAPGRGTRPALVAVAVLMMAVAAAVMWSRSVRLPPPENPTVVATSAPRSAAATPLPSPTSLPPATFVGAAACVGCHPAETAAWRGSQHAAAMQTATLATVLGDFDGATFAHGGVTSTFFRKDDRYLVRTDGPDGKLAEFPVAYTFGVYPLQQYLIPFPDGRLQALTIAWDARPRAAGGQRWFHLYPDEPADHRDALHWTRLRQNWNYGCAECHSTNLRRNYDPAADRYATTWSDLNVGCEACHGAGSRHVAWAERGPDANDRSDKGLTVALDERHQVAWLPNAAGNATRSRPLASRREVETCAVCHARRGVLGDDPGPTGRLLDTHLPAVLEAHLTFPDGQQREEVYTYGAFLQSKMYAHGVTCSDCHEPHGQQLRAPGNAVCAQCHAPERYDVRAHLLHEPGSAGGACAACHMPTRTYMQVDPRHDHSFRVPRPDLTVRYGVPNACDACHAERGAAWAAGAIAAAFGPERKGFQTFLEPIVAGRTRAPGALDGLAALVRDARVPAIARATALGDLAGFSDPAILPVVRAALADEDALVRVAALGALASLPPPTRVPLAAPLADDPVKAVRVKAGRMLAGMPAEALAPARRAARERAMAEYAASQTAIAETPEGHANLGSFHAEQGDAVRAEAEYRTAMRLEADFVPAYANLADLFRAAGRDGDAAAILEQGLAAAPDDASLSHAFGLARVRQRRLADAVPLLARAAAARPDDPRFAYVYGVALYEAGRRPEAIGALQAGLARAPYDRDLLASLALYARDTGEHAAARGYARRLVAVVPADPDARALLESLPPE